MVASDAHRLHHVRGFNVNYPLPDQCGDTRYLRAFGRAVEQIERFDPVTLVVALGFDTMKADPAGSLSLTPAALHRVGERLGRLGRPILVVQEGGYRLSNLRAGAKAFFSGLSEGLAPRSAAGRGRVRPAAARRGQSPTRA
jgi:acetoin utilization deacetylase AcuC-like enzyme